MSQEMEVRASLNTTTNVSSGYDATYGVEIEKKIDKQIVEILNRSNPLKQMIPRVSMNGQLSYWWNVRTVGNSSATFYGDGGSGTAATGTKVALQAVAKSMRVDWEVTGLMQAGSQSYYNAMQDEIRDAAMELALLEEKQIVDGTDSSAYGDATGFLGFKQIVDSFANSVASNTDAIYGDTRASGKTYLDCALVNGGANALTLADLDAAVTESEKAGGRPGFFLCSPERRDQINSLLQAQQRFVDRVEIGAGFRVISYNNIPIITSRFMDLGGESDTDTVLHLIAANNVEMRVLKEVTNEMIDTGRADTQGGFIKAYEVLVSKRLPHNVRIHNVTAV